MLERLLAGDPVAFGHFARLVTSILHDFRAYDLRDEWDDVVQDVITVVIEAGRARKLRDLQALPAFVRTTTRNHFWARLRGRKAPDSIEDPDAREDAPCWPRSAPRDARVDEIWEEVARLPEKQRLVIEAVYREGRTQQETVEATGIPLGNAKRFLAQGLATIRKRMAAGGDEVGR